MIRCEANCQCVSGLFAVEEIIEILFSRKQFGDQNYNRDHTEQHHKRPENVVRKAFADVAFVEIDKRLSDAATRTRKTSKHLKRTKRLRMLEMAVGIAEHQKKRKNQRR